MIALIFIVKITPMTTDPELHEHTIEQIDREIDSALYLEKYLVTLLGYVSFSFIIPFACALLCTGIMLDREKVRSISYKLIVTGFAVFLAIPLSVRTSETIYNTYESTIEQIISTADKISIVDEDAGAVEKFVSWIENAAGTIVDYVTGLLSKFVEAVAVMLVTSCLIPILVIAFFAWLIKIVWTNFIANLGADMIYCKYHKWRPM